MCIFCERAKASLDDPLAGLDGGGWSEYLNGSGGAGIKSRSNANMARKAGWEATLRQKREAERCEELRRRARLPVTVITGFLGAGKTTFVNHLLSARHGRRLAVIENEFGEVAIDDALLGGGGVERGEDAQQVILMPNGCMCCRVRGDLVNALKRLIESSASGSAASPEEAGTKPDKNDAAAERIASNRSGSIASADTDTQESAVVDGQERGMLDGIILECSGLDELAPVLQGRATWTTPARRQPLVLHRRLKVRGGGDEHSGGAIGNGPLGGQSFREHVPSPLVASSSPLIPEELPAGPVNPSSRQVPVLRLSSQGAAIETTLSRQQLAAELNCPLRDLRVADPTFPGQFPSVLARCGSIIFSVLEVKAVIRSKELLLFPASPGVMSIVPEVQEKIQPGLSVVGAPGVPFEQTAMECCLRHVCKELLESVRDVEPRVRKVLNAFETEKNSFIKSLHRLLPLKNELDELQETIASVCKCMNDVLLNDEDMALMYLTAGECNGGEARDPREHQEIEMLFENYLLQVELMASEVREFQNEVRNTEEIVEIELDVLRNNILRFELLLSISAFTVTLGALVTGVFGMNLLSGWEDKPQAFWQVTGGIYGCIVLSIAATVALCRRLSLL